MGNHFDLLAHEDNLHPLCDPLGAGYSNYTLRSAFMMWLNLGQQPKFKYVCDYYHCVEKMQSTLSLEKRLKLQSREIKWYSRQPSASGYWRYHISDVRMREIKEVLPEVCIFKLEGYCEIKADKYVKNKDVHLMSKTIRDYCTSHAISLNKWFNDFENFISKTETKKSFNVITGYVKNKLIKDEIQLYKNMQNIEKDQFSYINISLNEEEKEIMEEEERSKMDKDVDSITITKIHLPAYTLGQDVINATNDMKILIKKEKNKDIFKPVPRLPKSKRDGRYNGA